MRASLIRIEVHKKKGKKMSRKQSCGHTFRSCAATMAANKRVNASVLFHLTGILRTWMQGLVEVWDGCESRLKSCV